MSERIFRCCKKNPLFSVIYSVAGEQKHYHVCSHCIHLECFSKYIIQKTPIHTQSKKIFQNEISDETVENEIIDERIGEMIEYNETVAEQFEEKHLQFSSKNKKGAKQ